MSKIVNGVANDLEFPQLDFVHHDSKTNEPLQKQIETFTRWQDPTIKEKDKEIERLNNIINELEKWLQENIKISKAHDNQLGVNVSNIFLDKLKELKEGK